MHTEKYKTLPREIKDLNEWRNILCLWLERLNIVKIAYLLPTLVCRIDTIPIKMSAGLFFIEFDKLIAKFIWTCNETRIMPPPEKKKKNFEKGEQSLEI